MNHLSLKKYIPSLLFLIGGLFLGWLFFHSSNKRIENQDKQAEAPKNEVWTCSMHPQIRMPKPGKCPICGMDLIPLNQGNSTIGSDAVHMSREAAQLANVLTSVVSKQNPVKQIRLYGKVQADERLLQSQVSYLPGRIEKLSVNFTGEAVRKGQTLATIYSPELMTAQQELLETIKTKQVQPILYEAAKDKLRQWKLSDNQIADIEKSGTVKPDLEIYSNTTGIVTARRVNNGDYINPGSVLFDIADLSLVWIMFDAYESDLTYLSKGQNVLFTLEALPGINFSGNITFIDPVIDPVNRVAKVRVEISNRDGKLKPEMFATGMVEAHLDQYKDKLVIPRSAVLWTGKRSIVYVKQSGSEEVAFIIREIELGPMLGNSYVVMNGLSEGEEIVTQGAFSVDAAAQLAGKPSMMEPKGGQPVTAMPGMDMPGNAKPKIKATMPGMDMPASGSTEKLKITVSGNCEMCKARIEKAAKSVKGVTKAVWTAKTKILQVEYDTSLDNPDVIYKVIADAGHDNEKYKADDKVYEALPACCKYR
ncbi:MAG: efflux RND transporter periplasmic adaptor subunit [Bacteroidetes bacterium]|nr:efflux RND transporter periplasmic adaptor subunit [Bacteroidota bacterium]